MEIILIFFITLGIGILIGFFIFYRSIDSKQRKEIRELKRQRNNLNKIAKDWKELAEECLKRINE